MLTRTSHSSVIGRSASIRRMRRRTQTSSRLYCHTNGCTSFLEIQPELGRAVCPVCGFTKHLN